MQYTLNPPKPKQADWKTNKSRHEAWSKPNGLVFVIGLSENGMFRIRHRWFTAAT